MNEPTKFEADTECSLFDKPTFSPNPGSWEAVEKGCTCPTTDNNYGRGVDMGDGPMFWYTASCPVHGHEFDYGGFS